MCIEPRSVVFSAAPFWVDFGLQLSH